tara:strand:- start:973 stop:1461 length:489 start_codon:yes stop_codon:yes gene_type:complete
MSTHASEKLAALIAGVTSTLRYAIIAAGVFVIPAGAVPVVPNFSSGQLTQTTTSRSVISESIVSEDYATGWQYTVSGTGINLNGASIEPGAIINTNTTSASGITTKWTGLDVTNKPNWTLTQPGGSFQFQSSYSGPGLQNRTTITRTIETDTTIESVSVFSQ